ncbi:hypothetical protein H3S80_07830 [Bartonella sp. M0177]|uniref:hypothetical protein n=1 Tax=Bartonella sp. M0177 TaxID=2750940 RepID=UPI0018DE6D4B|nr:hypothetical protein [Bartonella sp. M0177]MBI0003956.1 hypothetical protein [Bartonella sp. M0177]
MAILILMKKLEKPFDFLEKAEITPKIAIRRKTSVSLPEIVKSGAKAMKNKKAETCRIC